MAHEAQRDFFKKVKQKFPNRFTSCSVLDVGSLDINGNNRFLFENYTYVGIDISLGPNVDIVCKGHEYKNEEQYDIVISSECFEHDMYYEQTIKNCVFLTRPNGMFTFTCASTGRLEHGTRRSNPADAPFLNSIPGWGDYYKNLTEDDIRNFLDVEEIFTSFYFEYNPQAKDLYFWGIKK